MICLTGALFEKRTLASDHRPEAAIKRDHALHGRRSAHD